ncbi:hypothetical protein CDL12_28545 [Handroanthus impetiginosus]|uniref:NB-ARC domain-containing protein n=1 Tax=Handroanthus impetiginosus TaxID=429701 RepID=A0A2G9G0W2_9LAMI|nr:hypothetical protein CDL12_28545 [Handroanthus impetiginosus]
MSHVLISSYNYLSQLYKPHFLYMGVFPLGCRISFSKLIKLWSAEGFLEPYLSSNLKISGMRCLNLLVSCSLVLCGDVSSGSEVHFKTCYLHSVYWYLCIKVAGTENFLHVLNRYADAFTEGIKCQRRLCIHNNVLFGIKEVRNSMESISTAYSLICTGPYHEYPVPICSDLRLLRVLDALTIRFYKFPIEVLKLVQLRYLALTFNGKVPGSISKLWNLETLIILRHLSINKSCKDSSYLPMEIWNMKELRHIQVTGSNLPDPCGALLSNLLSLSDVSVNSCSKEILEKTPNLKKLGIQNELSPDAVEPLCCFDHLSHLSCLESLKCVVANPKPRSQGPVWETYEGEFSRLKFLLLEDMDLVHWRANSIYCFPLLIKLIIMSCYKLKEIPSSFGCSSEVKYMKLVDCPSFRASARQLREEYQLHGIDVKSSLDDEKLK